MIYNLSNSLVKESTISIRTTGFVTDPKTILYPPLIFGDFTVSKGQNGWTIDKSSALVGHDSWTKYGIHTLVEPVFTGSHLKYPTTIKSWS